MGQRHTSKDGKALCAALGFNAVPPLLAPAPRTLREGLPTSFQGHGCKEPGARSGASTGAARAEPTPRRGVTEGGYPAYLQSKPPPNAGLDRARPSSPPLTPTRPAAEASLFSLAGIDKRPDGRDGACVLLAHSLVQARGADPRRSMLFLHGILGRRANWRSIARRFVEARPDWAALLPDLRAHGDSQGLPPPHTLRAAAADVEALAREADPPVRAVLGHSFGGKVGLVWAAHHARDLSQVWLVDSMPGDRCDMHGSEGTMRVVELLEQMRFPVTSREDFVARVVAWGGDEALGQWLAMNLERVDDDEHAWTLDLDMAAIRSLLEDYFVRDLWPEVRSVAEAGAEVHLVIAGTSKVYDEEDRARARALAEAVPRVHVHVIEGAGHWVHVEAPDAMLALLTAQTGP